MAKKQQSGGYNPDLLPNTCQVPNVILDHWMATLSDSELRVVMYAVRRTYGFGRKTNKISVPQFAHGLTDNEGEVLDRGTGLSERSVYRAVNSLVGKDILRERRNRGKDGGERSKSYSLNLRYLPPLPEEVPVKDTVEEALRGGDILSPGGMPESHRGGMTICHGGDCHNVTPLNIERNPERNPGDLPSVDPSARDPRPRESNPVDGEAGPTDRLTDGQTEENDSATNASASTTAQLLEPEEPKHEDSEAPILLPKEDEDNEPLKPEEALRQQAEAIPLSEVSEDALRLVRKVVDSFPSLEERDYRRVKRLAEHYQRQSRAAVFSGAASGLISEAERRKIRHPYSYLLACCVDMEKEFSEDDEAPLRSLSGENTSFSPEYSQPSGYEWFFSEGESDNADHEGEQRQHTPESDPEALALWEKILEDVSDEINAPSLRVWFEGTIPVALTADTLTVSVPNSFAKEYIESRFKELLEGALSKRLSPTSQASPGLEIVVGVEGYTDNTGMRESP